MAVKIDLVRFTVSQRSEDKERRESVAQSVTYWLIAAGIYLTFGVLFYYAAKEKLIDDSGTMPAALAKAYQGTFIASFPGTNGGWVIVGILEALVFLAIAASVLTGEFLPKRRKPILLMGLGLSMFTFAVIVWAESVTNQFATVAELFQYLAGTAVLILLILLTPPYRAARSLSLLRGPGEETRRRRAEHTPIHRIDAIPQEVSK